MFSNFFNKKSQQSQKNDELFSTDNLFDIVISLNKNYEIDLTIFANTSIDTKDVSISQKCADFFYTVNSGTLKNHMIDILLKDVQENFHDKKFIENIIILWTMLVRNTIINNKQQTLINPSEVFRKYIK